VPEPDVWEDATRSKAGSNHSPSSASPSPPASWPPSGPGSSSGGIWRP